ncbi:hypothetical protein PR048_013146 [Dryococelus australis]|uniref:Uncharacterized protein n=1 Tax=Dryococelus australis TaxID=614101 RepID=A0ABQ9HRF6_9NEOP|nr:hypothetical protein PR048_013146 [Dryococelus australis]
MCNVEKAIHTNKINEHDVDINTLAVVGTLEEVFTTINIPSMSYKMFRKYHDKISDCWQETAHHEIEDAAQSRR